jgi:hypothetical protein
MAKPLLTGGNGKSNDFVGTATGQVPVWTNTGDEWVLGTGSGGGGGGRLFYLNDSTAPESPTTNIPTGASGETVKELGTVADAASTTVLSTSSVPVIPAAPELVIGFVTDLGVPGVDAIPAGLWEFNVWAEATGNTTNQSYLQAKIYKYAANGLSAPVFVAESAPSYIFDPNDVTQYTLTALIPGGTTLLATDRIYVEILAGSSTVNRQITLHFGNGEPSHVHTTILVPVNLATDVTGILLVANGGTGVGTSGGTVNAAANTVFAGPNGSAGQPSFRALVAADIAGISPYDLRGWFPGTPAGDAILDRFVADRAFTISDTEANQYFRAIYTSLAANVVLAVKRNGTAVFTATFASGDTTSNGYKVPTIGTIDEAQDNVGLGDIITIETVGAVDPSFSYPLWTIYGTV